MPQYGLSKRQLIAELERLVGNYISKGGLLGKKALPGKTILGGPKTLYTLQGLEGSEERKNLLTFVKENNVKDTTDFFDKIIEHQDSLKAQGKDVSY